MAGVRGKVGQLLIDTEPFYRWHGTDRGIDWVTDRYVIARSDVFKRPPAAGLDLPTGVIRRILDRARGEKRHPAGDTGHRLNDGSAVVKALIGVAATQRLGGTYIRGPYVAVNPKAWDGWMGLGLDPFIVPETSQVLWYGTVRGKPSLFGVLQGCSIGRPA